MINRRTVLKGSVIGAASLAFSPIARISAQESASEIEVALTQSFVEPGHPAMQLVEAFNAKGLGTTVTATNYGANYEEIMQRAQANISAGIGPALVLTGWKYALFADAALNLVDLSEVGGDETQATLDRYRPWVVDIIRLNNGKLAGLPFSLSTPVLYYNRDILQAAGLEADPVLTTWEDVTAAAQAVKENTEVEAPILVEINEWTAQTFIQNTGGFVLDAEGKAVFDSEEATEGMRYWTDMRDAGVVMPMASDQMRPAFLSGDGAFYVSSIAGLAGLRASIEFDLGTATFPTSGDKPLNPPSGGNFLGVYTQDAAQQAAAWEFLKFCASTEAVEIWNETGYLIATVDDIAPLPGQEPAYVQMEGGLTNETIWPGPRGLEAMTVFVDWMNRVVNDQVELESGMADGNAAVAELLP